MASRLRSFESWIQFQGRFLYDDHGISLVLLIRFGVAFKKGLFIAARNHLRFSKKVLNQANVIIKKD